MRRWSSSDFPRLYSLCAKAFFCLLGGFLYGVFGLYGHMYAPGPRHSDLVARVRKNASVSHIAESLSRQGLIRSATLFKAYLLLKGHDRQIKKGDYVFDSQASAAVIADTILNGYGIFYHLRVLPGLTNYQILNLLTSHSFLQEDAFEMPVEGTLFPDSYKIEGGTFISSVLDRLHHKMLQELYRVWAGRSLNLFLKTPDEVLILASMIEKETYVKAERALISGVFINRLKLGMKLQSDPTTIYGLSQGRGRLGRPILLRDLKDKSAFNTYFIKGLPPTPICNPGYASLYAAAHPVDTEHLFFVADGRGGHRFSKAYKDHVTHIQNLRTFLSKKKL